MAIKVLFVVSALENSEMTFAAPNRAWLLPEVRSANTSPLPAPIDEVMPPPAATKEFPVIELAPVIVDDILRVVPPSAPVSEPPAKGR